MKEQILKWLVQFFKEYVMTNEDFKAWLKKVGVKVDDLTQDAYEKLQEAKAQLDTQTRRKCRIFWLPVSVVTFLIGLGFGHLFF
jgi:hypothetical protein